MENWVLDRQLELINNMFTTYIKGYSLNYLDNVLDKELALVDKLLNKNLIDNMDAKYRKEMLVCLFERMKTDLPRAKNNSNAIKCPDMFDFFTYEREVIREMIGSIQGSYYTWHIAKLVEIKERLISDIECEV